MQIRKVDKKIICIIAPYGYSLYNKISETLFVGGSEAQLYLLANEFEKSKNFDVNVITGYYNTREKKFEVYQNIKVFNVLPLKRGFKNYIKGFFNLFYALRKINPDIVIQRTADKITGLCAFYCNLFKKRFIYSIANKPDVNGEAEKGIFGKFYKYGLDNAAFIVAQNKEQILELEKYKKRKFKNIKVIKSGYEIKEVDLKQKIHILWVARAIDWKRPELFLNLTQKFPNEKFIMICNKLSYDEKYWKAIFSKASKISNLNFIEYVPFHEIDRYFLEAKILVNTSTHEGFPNTFIQAFKNNTPVLSLSVNPDNLLTNNKIGFFCNDDFNKMVKNLRVLLEDRDLFETYARNAYFYAKKTHDIRNISHEWVQLILKLLKIFNS